MHETVNIFWFRRDLRLNDNHGLFEALISGRRVILVFIFDKEILDKLEADDKRVQFIYQRLLKLNDELRKRGGGISIFYGSVKEVFEAIVERYNVEKVFANHDYEPYAITRDKHIKDFLKNRRIQMLTFKDQVIFEAGDILKPDGKPYVIFTPYKRRWLEMLPTYIENNYIPSHYSDSIFKQTDIQFPSLIQMGFINENFSFPSEVISAETIRNYAERRDFPALDATSRLGLHLRFGTVSIRDCVRIANELSPSWLNELIWREFFMQILAAFPHVVESAFKPEYDRIEWINDITQFQRWCEGKTGFPLIDAGMRELIATGFMHNRVRMVTASLLTKHLLIDWRLGESWFASKLLDYELASNNGNWQWAAGSGCDAAPYFRIFNPMEQARKFDPDEIYVKRWIPEYGTPAYSKPMVDIKETRKRCLKAYHAALNGR